MPVPKAPVQKDHLPAGRKYQVWTTGQVTSVQPIPVSHTVHEPTKLHLGLRILVAHTGHALASLFARKGVSHQMSTHHWPRTIPAENSEFCRRLPFERKIPGSGLAIRLTQCTRHADRIGFCSPTRTGRSNGWSAKTTTGSFWPLPVSNRSLINLPQPVRHSAQSTPRWLSQSQSTNIEAAAVLLRMLKSLSIILPHKMLGS